MKRILIVLVFLLIIIVGIPEKKEDKISVFIEMWNYADFMERNIGIYDLKISTVSVPYWEKSEYDRISSCCEVSQTEKDYEIITEYVTEINGLCSELLNTSISPSDLSMENEIENSKLLLNLSVQDNIKGMIYCRFFENGKGYLWYVNDRYYFIFDSKLVDEIVKVGNEYFEFTPCWVP